MQRFYMCHPFQRFDRFLAAMAALSLATKDGTPVKAKHIVEVSDRCLNRRSPNSHVAECKEQELLQVKDIMQQTLGPAGVKVESPQEHIHKIHQEYYHKYFYMDSAETEETDMGELERDVKLAVHIATNSLHWTTMCLTHSPALAAAMCLRLASKWLDHCLVDFGLSASAAVLDNLEKQFLDRCPPKLVLMMMQAVAPVKKMEIITKPSRQMTTSETTKKRKADEELMMPRKKVQTEE